MRWYGLDQCSHVYTSQYCCSIIGSPVVISYRNVCFRCLYVSFQGIIRIIFNFLGFSETSLTVRTLHIWEIAIRSTKFRFTNFLRECKLLVGAGTACTMQGVQVRHGYCMMAFFFLRLQCLTNSGTVAGTHHHQSATLKTIDGDDTKTGRALRFFELANCERRKCRVCVCAFLLH
jgi:hypothetical protein